MSSTDVDVYIDTKLDPKHRGTVDALRALMADAAPDATECLTYGSPAWRGAKILAVISPSKTHLTFAFERGAEFDDPHGLLQGVGKRTRHVKIKPGADLNEAALRDYIAQATALDAA
ncbi:DUF1801 domain-containing protein [Actinomadura sediminis]|uniref:DUF1801 domain-containing protein n=1 Tax=Actinomadura sediminis TaxID=1038904 RepID=A0ABW3EVD2_9ACTN